MREVVTFHSTDGRVMVTSTRLIVGNAVYTISSIKAVKLVASKPGRLGFAICIGIGVVLLLAGGKAQNLDVVLFGGFLIVLVAIWWMMQEPTYHLRIAPGNTDVLSSKEEQEIVPVLQALDEAIIHRG